MRASLAVVVLLVLAGCGQPEAPPSPAHTPAPPAPAVPASDDPAAPAADGSPLVFVDGDGSPAATVDCSLEGLTITVPGFRAIASEDRLSLGTEGEAYTLVADLAAPGPGVTASGSPDADLVDRLARSEALFARYGQQTVGPLTAPSPAGLQTLVAVCRGQE